MPKRSSKGRDSNVAAFNIVAAATGEQPAQADDGKNPAAVALGRLGGLKGGKARATALSAKRRKEIATNAAEKRWGKKKPKA